VSAGGIVNVPAARPQQFLADDTGDALALRQVDVDGLAGTVAQPHCGERDTRPQHGHELVGIVDVVARPHRRVGLGARERHQPTERLQGGPEADEVALRSGFALTAQGEQDDARVAGAQLVEPDTHPLEDSPPEVLDDEVGGLHEVEEHGTAGLGLQVDRDPTFAAVDGSERRAGVDVR
jgi:hypothetical protein